MRFAIVLVPEVGQATGPDLTRYLLVCAGLVVGLLTLAWVFRRFVAGHLRARAAKRSLRVLDVLPLSGKHKLVVVRCYDRSFLLGLGEKEVRAIAELDAESVTGQMDAPDAPDEGHAEVPAQSTPFRERLAERLGRRLEADEDEAFVPTPPAPAPREQPSLGSKDGLLA